MRASLPVLQTVCLIALASGGCGAAAGDTGRVCQPILSWTAPAYRCKAAAATAPTAPPIATELTPAQEQAVAEPEPEKETEPERPEPEKPEPEKPEARVVVKERAIEISERVQFGSGSADLLPESEKLLSEVAEAMKAHPEILRVRIEGYTDSRADRHHNKELSVARALAVRKYLIEQGVTPGRLVARGYGERHPIAENSTQEGRYKNRRVELKIVKRRGK